MDVVYIDDADLVAVGLASTRGTSDQRTAARVAASSIASSHFRARYTLPLLAWDAAVRMHVAALAARELLTVIGWEPEAPANKGLVARAERAEKWFAAVAARQLHPDVTESAPVVYATAALSDPLRGW